MGKKDKKKQKQKKKAPPPEPEPEPVVDYGATADAYFADDSSHQGDEEEEEDTSLELHEEEKVEPEEEEGGSSSEEEEEQKEEGGSSSEEEGEGDDDEEEEEEEEAEANNARLNLADGEEACSFDLRNLTAINNHPLNEAVLYDKKKFTKQDRLTIGNGTTNTNEAYLLKKATEGCTQLIAALWELPTERSDAGPMVTLPSYDVIPVPRALPPPPPKVETRWEKFAKERGIAPKEKRSRKVWDEDTNSWKHRHGYDRANSDTSRYEPIMEVGGNDDPYEDPWERQRDEKYARTEANRKNQMRNQEKAGMIPKGTTSNVLKSREKARAIGKEGGRKDNQMPSGVPVDVNGKVLRGKESTMAALKATQVSTASLGKFDKLREGEPERKEILKVQKKKRKFMAEGNTVRGGGGEQERASKVLESVLAGGGVAKEKARKKGKLAKGVTAYDYEYDDGYDKTIFSKKKGRAGAGKNKKMTKKRIK